MVYDSKFFLISISLFILMLNKWKQEERRGEGGKSVKNAMVLKKLDRKWSSWNLN